MGKSINIIGLLLIGAFVSVNGLQCYVCENCATVKDADLRECPMATSTTTPVSTTSSGLTSETSPISTSVSGATSESTPISTTVSGATSESTPISTTVSGATSESTPISTTVSGATSEPTTNSTIVSGATSDPTQNSTTVSGATSDPTQNSTTVSGATSDPTQNSTTVSGATSESMQNSTTVSGTTSESTLIISDTSDSVNIVATKAERVKRHVLREVMGNKCSCDGKACSCGEDTLSRMGQYAGTDVKYVCIKVNRKDNNGTEMVTRGCVPAEVEGATICTIEQQNNSTISCSTCDKDKCNGSFTLRQSFSIILLLVSAALLTSE